MNQDPSRPTCQRRLRLILLSVLLASFVFGGSAFAAAPKLNVIFILADDLAVLAVSFVIRPASFTAPQSLKCSVKNVSINSTAKP
jgi:hypothetical protein